MSDPAYPESPCVGVCQLDDERTHCVGCGRTLEEIGAWSRMSAAEKRAVLERLQAWRPGSGGGDCQERGA